MEIFDAQKLTHIHFTKNMQPQCKINLQRLRLNWLWLWNIKRNPYYDPNSKRSCHNSWKFNVRQIWRTKISILVNLDLLKMFKVILPQIKAQKHSVEITEIYPHFKKFSWNQFVELLFSEKMLWWNFC